MFASNHLSNMLRILNTLFLFAALALVPACSEGSSSTTGELATVMTEIADVLDGVETPEAAKEARETLEPLVGRMTKLQNEAADSKTATVSSASEAEAFAKATTRYSEALTRVLSAPKLSEELSDVLTP